MDSKSTTIRKCVRLSEEVVCYIEQQEGGSFTDKLSRLILEVKNGENERKRRLDHLNERIASEQRALARTVRTHDDVRNLQRRVTHFYKQFAELQEDIDKIFDEMKEKEE